MGLTLISFLVDSREAEGRGRRWRGALTVRAAGEGICHELAGMAKEAGAAAASVETTLGMEDFTSRRVRQANFTSILNENRATRSLR